MHYVIPYIHLYRMLIKTCSRKTKRLHKIEVTMFNDKRRFRGKEPWNYLKTLERMGFQLKGACLLVEHAPFSKYTKIEKRWRRKDLENQRCTKGGRGGKSCEKKFKGIAKFNWKKRIQVVPASAKMYYAVLTDVAST